MEESLFFLGCFLMAITLPGTLALAVLTGAGVWPHAEKGPSQQKNPSGKLRLAVIIPAHNEEKIIGRTLLSLRECPFSKEMSQIIVVADNCSDGTAQVAEKSGVRVLVREDCGRRGKGYALDYAFKILLQENFDAFIVVDADTAVEPNFLVAMQQKFLEGAEAVQALYGVLDSGNSIRIRLMKVAFFAMNILRPRGRNRLGFSAGILGNGFGLRRECLETVPYEAGSIVEDLEYHLNLVQAGKTVHFVDKTRVLAIMPEGGTGYRTQRMRWEGGRLGLFFRRAPLLFGELSRGKWRLVEPLFDLLTMPLATHCLVLFFLCLLPGFFNYAVLGLTVVAIHVLVAIIVGKGDWKDLFVVFYVPVYVVWKATIFPATLKAASKKTPWIRTKR